MDWSKYPNFSKSEFDCRDTGENAMQPSLAVSFIIKT